jgi:hypothetical protein
MCTRCDVEWHNDSDEKIVKNSNDDAHMIEYDRQQRRIPIIQSHICQQLNVEWKVVSRYLITF